MLSRSLCLVVGLALLTGAVLSISAPPAAAAALPPLPTYTVQKAHTPPVIDGKLDEAAWAFAPEFKLVDCPTGGPAREMTKVKMLWHDDYIYVGALVYEKDIQDHSRKNGDSVFMESCLELYLEAPGGLPTLEAPFRYHEMDVSPKGNFYNVRVTNWRPRHAKPMLYKFEGDESYRPSDLLAATRVVGTLNDGREDKGWWVEMQVPLIGPPMGWPQSMLEGVLREQWRFNVYRIHKFNTPDQEAQAFSPTGEFNFHVPTRFAYLRFADSPYWPWP